MRPVTFPMEPEILNMPAGALMRAVRCVHAEDSIGSAAVRLRDTGLPVIPVLDDYGHLSGVISEQVILDALAEGIAPTELASSFQEEAVTMASYESGAAALRMFMDNGEGAIVIVDPENRPRGILLPSDLLVRPRYPVRPESVGGMATPLGVYLTTGSVQAGAGPKGLILTGMWMGSRIAIATVIATLLGNWLKTKGLSDAATFDTIRILTLTLFLGVMRFSGLSGIHAAEHMVVHAIERDEELVPETVRRMPRVHPRCGTNIAVGFTVFLTVSGAINDTEGLGVLLGAVATLFVWRPLGSFVQYWITTKKPNAKQLESGIRAGKELLEKFRTSAPVRPSVGRRIYCSGILHVLFGAAVVVGLFFGLLVLVHRSDLLAGF